MKRKKNCSLRVSVDSSEEWNDENVKCVGGWNGYEMRVQRLTQASVLRRSTCGGPGLISCESFGILCFLHRSAPTAIPLAYCLGSAPHFCGLCANFVKNSTVCGNWTRHICVQSQWCKPLDYRGRLFIAGIIFYLVCNCYWRIFPSYSHFFRQFFRPGVIFNNWKNLLLKPTTVVTLQ